ncbi:hypothetical protein JTB14_019933 [Gonioctena quinquepunctata]|nr:hypothetical protein JTB14_019933 [Gonioctena quinquepunctata]
MGEMTQEVGRRKHTCRRAARNHKTACYIIFQKKTTKLKANIMHASKERYEECRAVLKKTIMGAMQRAWEKVIGWGRRVKRRPDCYKQDQKPSDINHVGQ